MRTLGLVAVSLVLTLSAAAAKSWAPRTDLEIVALDAATGAVVWSRRTTPLGNAHFELYPKLLAVYPHYDPTDRSDPTFLDPKTGAVVQDTRRRARPIARSSAQWVREPVVLANGWRLDGFDPGNTRDLALTDPKTKQVVWTIKPAHYPEYVLGYRDVLLVAYGYLTDEAVIFGYRAGAKQPAWTLDFNRLLGKPKAKAQRLGRVALQIIGDVLYAQTGPHVFAIAPATGKILWQLDAAAATGLRYEPDLYGGALDIAVFSRDRDTVVVAFENRILAVSATTGALRWHLAPDTFPHAAFPLVRDGLVYITSGKARGKAVAAPRTAAK